MKGFKAVLATILTFSLVCSIIGIKPALIAYASSISVSFDSKTSQLTITPTVDATYIYIGIAKNGAVATYDVMELPAGLSDVIIDLSSFNPKKDLELWIHDNLCEVDLKQIIKKNDIKLGLEYLPTGNDINDYIKATGISDLSALEYRLGGEWKSNFGSTQLTKEMINSYKLFGGTIYFRVKGDANQFAGTEIKLKIPKMGNPPKVSIDYSKLTVKFPKGVQIKTSSKSAWTNLDKANLLAGSYSLKDIIDLSKENTINVRIAPTTKKSESKIMQINFDAQREAPAADNSILNVEYITDPIKQTVKTLLTNTTDSVLEYCFISSAQPNISDINLQTQKWTKINANKSSIIEKIDNNGKLIVFRYASEKNKKTDITSLASELAIHSKSLKTIYGEEINDKEMTDVESIGFGITSTNTSNIAVGNGDYKGSSYTLEIFADKGDKTYFTVTKAMDQTISNVSGAILHEDGTIDGSYIYPELFVFEADTMNLSYGQTTIITFKLNEADKESIYVTLKLKIRELLPTSLETVSFSGTKNNTGNVMFGGGDFTNTTAAINVYADQGDKVYFNVGKAAYQTISDVAGAILHENGIVDGSKLTPEFLVLEVDTKNLNKGQKTIITFKVNETNKSSIYYTLTLYIN